MTKMKWGGAEHYASYQTIERGEAYSGSSCFLYAKGGETV